MYRCRLCYKVNLDVLLPEIIFGRTEEDILVIISSFENVSGFPQALGALDGCPIRIRAVGDADGYIC